MSEETLNQILQIIILIFGVGGGGSALYYGGRKIGQKQLAEHWEDRYNQANEARIEQNTMIQKLQKDVNEKTGIINEINARLKILTDERADERLRYQKDRDEVMKQYGAVEHQMKELSQKFERLQAEKQELLANNQYLEETNRELIKVKSECEKTTKERDQLKSDLDTAQRKIKTLETS